MIAVAAVRSTPFMPPERWMISLKPRPETLGETLKRLRLARGWSQEQVEEMTNISQTRLSAYERDAYAPKRAAMRQLNDLYELPPNTLSEIAWRDDAWRQESEPERLPGPSVAIPAEPELIEAVRALYLLETNELPHVTTFARRIAEGPPQDRDQLDDRADESAASA